MVRVTQARFVFGRRWIEWVGPNGYRHMPAGAAAFHWPMALLAAIDAAWED